MNFLFDHDVPDDTAFSLEALGHVVFELREVAPPTTPDDEVLRLAGIRGCVLITCNRDDFLPAAARVAHHGIIILIRRKSRALERSALVRLLDSAGESGLNGNINFGWGDTLIVLIMSISPISTLSLALPVRRASTRMSASPLPRLRAALNYRHEQVSFPQENDNLSSRIARRTYGRG